MSGWLVEVVGGFNQDVVDRNVGFERGDGKLWIVRRGTSLARLDECILSARTLSIKGTVKMGSFSSWIGRSVLQEDGTKKREKRDWS